MSNTRSIKAVPDEGGTFDVDALIAESNLDDFTFTLGGVQRTLPHFSTLTFQQGMALEEGRIAEVLAEASGDEALGNLFINLPGFAANQLIERWAEAAGVRLGDTRPSTRS